MKYPIVFAGLSVVLLLAGCNDDLPTGTAQADVGSGSGLGAPVACFSTEPDPPEVGVQQPITLDASCSTNVDSSTTFTWNVGDDRTMTGRRIEVQYRRSGDYNVTLRVSNGGNTSEATRQVRVHPRAEACFVFRQILGQESEQCTVAFDASCASGAIREYRWFFEGGPRQDINVPLPDTNRTTTEPQITYSWGRDEECFSFRPFDRIVRLTVVDENGGTDEHEETVAFNTPALKP
jgi:hypothetical protein